jgi:hypothetical protein
VRFHAAVGLNPSFSKSIKSFRAAAATRLSVGHGQ